MNDTAKHSLSPSRRVLTTGELGQLHEGARLKLRSLSAAMRWIDEQGRNKSKAYRELHASQRLGELSLSRIKQLHLNWLADGEYGVIDHRLCGGCGLPGCGNQHRASLLRQATVNYWVELATANKVHNGKAYGPTVTFKHAWKQLLNELCKGSAIPGLTNEATPGTWHQLWVNVHPAKACPKVCPWSTTRPPPGFSLQNFSLRKPDKALITTAQQGYGAGIQLVPEVRTDVSKLMPMEWLHFDDKRLDILLLVMVDGKPQFVEAWCLFAIDVCSRRIAGFQLIPRITRKDGTQRGISRRDVAHLTANILRLHGYPTAYKATWKGENAAAAFTDELVELIERATFGQVAVKTSGTYSERVTLAGALNQGGNPQGKAYIESFNRTLDKLVGALPGQMGATYQRKSGDSDAILLQDTKLVKSVAHLATLDEMASLTTHLTEEALIPLLLQALHDYNNDPLHTCQGFSQVTKWRHGIGGEWFALDGPEMTQLMAQFGAEWVTQYLQSDARIETRMETRMERWTRLYNPRHFARVDGATYSDLCTDIASAKYDVVGRLLCSYKPLSGRKIELEFRGMVPALEVGHTYRVRFDFERLEMGCFIQSEQGRFLGSMSYSARVDARNEEALKEALGEKRHATAELMKRTRRTVEREGTILGEIERIDRTNTFLSSLLPNGQVIEAESVPSSRALAELKAKRESEALSPKFNVQDEQAKALEFARQARAVEAAPIEDFEEENESFSTPETDQSSSLADW